MYKFNRNLYVYTLYTERKWGTIIVQSWKKNILGICNIFMQHSTINQQKLKKIIGTPGSMEGSHKPNTEGEKSQTWKST